MIPEASEAVPRPFPTTGSGASWSRGRGRRRRFLAKALPNGGPTLPGAVVAQYRTVKGKTCGPYWFRMWREGGRLRKAYVPRERLEETRAACAAWAEARRLRSELRSGTRGFLSDMTVLVRVMGKVDRYGDDCPLTPYEEARMERMIRFGIRGLEAGQTILRSTTGGTKGWDPLESTCRHASLSIL